MQLTVDERRAVEAGQPLRCAIPGTNVRGVIMRDDVFAKLQLPVSVVDRELLDDIYLGLASDSPDDWKAPEEWAAGATPS